MFLSMVCWKLNMFMTIVVVVVVVVFSAFGVIVYVKQRLAGTSFPG